MKFIKRIYDGSIIVETEGLGEVVITPSIYKNKNEKQVLVSFEDFYNILKELGVGEEREELHDEHIY